MSTYAIERRRVWDGPEEWIAWDSTSSRERALELLAWRRDESPDQVFRAVEIVTTRTVLDAGDE